MSDTTYTAGQWYESDCEERVYRSVFEYAQSNNIPIVNIVTKYSDSQCHYCALFRTNYYETDRFVEWMKTSGYLFGKLKDKAPNDNDNDWVDYIAGDNTGYPFVMLYWKKADGTEVISRFMGRQATGIGDQNKDGLYNVEDFIIRIENAFSAYSPNETNNSSTLAYNTLMFDPSGGEGVINPIQTSVADTAEISSYGTEQVLSSESTFVTAYVYKGQTYYPGKWIYNPDKNGSLMKKLVADGKSVYCETTNLNYNNGKISSGSCMHCWNFYKYVLRSSAFKQMMQNSGIYYICYTDNITWQAEAARKLPGVGSNLRTWSIVYDKKSDSLVNKLIYDFWDESPCGILYKNSKTFYLHSNTTWKKVNTELKSFSNDYKEISAKELARLIGYFQNCEPDDGVDRTTSSDTASSKS